MEYKTIAGNFYTITSKSGCSVTDATGTLSMTVDAGGQLTVQAPSDKLVYDDEQAIVFKANFKHALAALSLLGGGDNLPAGYISLAFLEAPSGGVGIDLEYVPTGQSGFHTEFEVNNSAAQYQHVLSSCGVRYNADGSVAGSDTLLFTPHLNNASYKFFAAKLKNDGSAWTYIKYNPFPFNQKLQADFNWLGDLTVRATGQGDGQMPDGLMVRNGVQTWLFCQPGMPASGLHGRIYSASISEGARVVRNYVPAVDRNGECCMVDTMHKRTYLSKTDGLLVAGFTLEQARKLGTLPAGTTLTISLPVGYDSDEGVVNALAQAGDNGCVLTIQTYEAASAATTFALRRVWVRKTQADYGSYVDADGTRWLVEWCVDIIGADPESLGYERFRSVDAAVGYWELVPYQHPEDELSNVE